MALTPAQKAIRDAFMRRTARLSSVDAAALDVPETERCGLVVNGGGVAAGEGRLTPRGAYTLSFPADTLWSALPRGTAITIDEEPGRHFVIVFDPPAGNLNLSRRYEVDGEE